MNVYAATMTVRHHASSRLCQPSPTIAVSLELVDWLLQNSHVTAKLSRRPAPSRPTFSPEKSLEQVRHALARTLAKGAYLAGWEGAHPLFMKQPDEQTFRGERRIKNFMILKRLTQDRSPVPVFLALAHGFAGMDASRPPSAPIFWIIRPPARQAQPRRSPPRPPRNCGATATLSRLGICSDWRKYVCAASTKVLAFQFDEALIAFHSAARLDGHGQMTAAEQTRLAVARGLDGVRNGIVFIAGIGAHVTRRAELHHEESDRPVRTCLKSQLAVEFQRCAEHHRQQVSPRPA